MTTELVFEGKTVQDAVDTACRATQIPRNKLRYDVISNGSTGIFGLVGVKKAKIRIIQSEAVINASDAKETISSGNGNQSYSYDPQEVQSLVDEAFNVPASKPASRPAAKSSPKHDNNRPATRSSAAETSNSGMKKIFPQVDAAKQDETTISAPPSAPDNHQKPDVTNGSADTKKSKPATGSKPNRKPEPASEASQPSPEILAAVEAGKEALEKVLTYITDDTTIEIEYKKDIIVYNINGGNSSVLIGKRGQNLEAIQYLIDKVANKNIDRRIRIQVDVAGYIEKRKENLIRLAERMAQKTKKTGKPSTVGPMNAQDRRIVHITLKNNRGVRTQSIGDGYYRKLMIFPKKASGYKKKHQNDTKNSVNKTPRKESAQQKETA